MGGISSNLHFLLLISVLQSCLLQNLAISTDSSPRLWEAREALEIIIGGGKPPEAPPENQECPPPPPPLIFESKRLEIVYPVIQRLKKKITCDPKGIKNTWVGANVCNYTGFSCATVPDLNVQALAAVDFNQFYFDGPELILDGFIDELPDVTVFHANSNNFKGQIPKKISTLRYLFELDLSNNKLQSEFPYEVLGATNLTFLDLRFNSFSGCVPPQIFLLDLDVLFINNNNFLQNLPENLGCTPVIYLTLANNNFTGPIPRSIGQAGNTLQEVLFLNNRLTGCLPSEIGLLKKATVFDASKNMLSGPIPLSFACLGRIEDLNLGRNQLCGPVPEMVCKLPKLANFTLSSNYFTEIGPICKKKIQNKVLDVSNNCIPGLPNQRPKCDCDAFFAKPKNCKPNGWIPCDLRKLEVESMKETSAPSPSPMASYTALKPH